MTRRGLVAALLVASHIGFPVAQVRVVRYGDNRLTGIAEVDVLVSQATTVAGCPLNTGDTRQLALSTLRDHGLRATASEKARSWHYSVVVEVHTSATKDSCASAVTSELVAEVAGIPDADKTAAPGAWGSLLIGPMALVRETALVIGPGVAHDASVRQAVGAQVAAIGARIRSANQ